MREGEQYHVAEGKAARGIYEDVSQFSAWRKIARADNLRLLELYGSFLVGQYAGMGRALSLDAVRAALDIEGIDRSIWPDLAERLIVLHGVYVDNLPKDH